MKKIHLFILGSFILSKSYCQFFDHCGLMGGYNPSGHTWMHLDGYQTDRYGNTFSKISGQDCLGCPYEQYISWGGPSGSGSLNWSYGSGTQMFADGIGDLFVFGTISLSGTVIFGTTFSSGQKVLVKSGNPSWAMVTNASSVAVNDSGYCFMLRSDSIQLYSPAGLLLWVRPGGGSQIFGNNNLSYIVRTSSGIIKYRKNGTVAWQSSIAGSFRVTPHNRIVVKLAGTVYELSTSTGQTLSVHAGSTQGGLMDNEGNGYSYSGNTLTKYDSTGMVWQAHLTGTVFANVGIDMYDNIHFANNYVSHNLNSYGEWVNPPNKLFIPPTLYIDPPYLDGSNWGYYAAYTGRINQQDKLNEKITMGNLKAVCKKSTTLVPFSVNQYRVGFENGFRAEMSDASGDFSNPTVIGTGLLSPISTNTSFFNAFGNKYKIRVVSNNPEVFSKAVKVPQFVYPPKAEIIVAHSFYIGDYPTFCAPAVLIATPGNNTYQWFKRTPGVNSFTAIYSNNNNSLTVSSSGGDMYKVIITDTATGCPATGLKNYFYTYNGIAHPDFYLPDTVPLNNGAVDLSLGFNGSFSGTGVSDNKFYPDSAGAGLHPVQWHTSDPASCYSTSDTTKFIYVRNYKKPIGSVHMSPAKDGYCSEDTVLVSFSYDSTLFNASTNFTVQMGIINEYDGSFYRTDIIGTGASSPVTCIMPQLIDTYDGSNYRVRVVSTNPSYTSAYNYEGDFKMGSPEDPTLTPYGGTANCAAENTWISVTGGSLNSPVYYWHFNNQTFVDSILLETEGYLNLPVSHGSTFLATQPGTYSVDIVNEYGCHTFSDTILIGNGTAPSGTASPASASICPGDSAHITLQTDPLNTVQWLKNNVAFSTSDPLSFYVTESGKYSVIITNPVSGCYIKKVNTVNITYKALPNTTITTPGTTTHCEGNNVTLNAYYSSNYHYQWIKDGVDLTGTWSHAATYHASLSGTYKVRITDIVTGCTGTTTNGIVVTMKPLPPATITPQGPVTFCAGDSVILSANTGTGFTYKWKKNNGYITGAIAVDYAAYTAGDYQVEVTSNGCSSTSTIISVTVPCRLSEDDAENENAFKATVSPNPSSGDFVFEFSNAASEDISLELLDVVGKSILKVTVSGLEYVIRKEQLSAGIYSAVISDGNRQKELKLVKTD